MSEASEMVPSRFIIISRVASKPRPFVWLGVELSRKVSKVWYVPATIIGIGTPTLKVSSMP